MLCLGLGPPNKIRTTKPYTAKVFFHIIGFCWIVETHDAMMSGHLVDSWYVQSQGTRELWVPGTRTSLKHPRPLLTQPERPKSIK